MPLDICHKCGVTITPTTRYFENKPTCRGCWMLLIDAETERHTKRLIVLDVKCPTCGGAVSRVDEVWVHCTACGVDILA